MPNQPCIICMNKIRLIFLRIDIITTNVCRSYPRSDFVLSPQFVVIPAHRFQISNHQPAQHSPHLTTRLLILNLISAPYFPLILNPVRLPDFTKCEHSQVCRIWVDSLLVSSITIRFAVIGLIRFTRPSKEYVVHAHRRITHLWVQNAIPYRKVKPTFASAASLVSVHRSRNAGRPQSFPAQYRCRVRSRARYPFADP